MNRRSVIRYGAASALAGVGMLFGGAAFAADMVLKSADVHPLGYPTVQAVENLGKKLEEATGGRLSVQIYPSMQLGGEKETLEQVQVGALAMTRVSVGVMGPIIDDSTSSTCPSSSAASTTCTM
jgi:TRAP-type C4-dicarboxylate transport system substrate-binding protein